MDGRQWLGARLSRNEEVRWVNEGRPPSKKDREEGIILHDGARGYLICTSCGRMLRQPEPEKPAGGRRKAKTEKKQDDIGHAEGCPHKGSNPVPLAISTAEQAEVLRLLVPIPVPSLAELESRLSWGRSLGYSLLTGMQHFFMLDSGELDFELEGPWPTGDATNRYGMLSLAFIDPSLGGSGYLVRIAEQFHHVARQAIDHLDHPDCETACYRCLKSYYNQRYHQELKWPQVMPALEELAGARRNTDRARRATSTIRVPGWKPMPLVSVRHLSWRSCGCSRRMASIPRSRCRWPRTLVSSPSPSPTSRCPSNGWPFISTVRPSTSAMPCAGIGLSVTGSATAIHRGGWRSCGRLTWPREPLLLRN